jgi:hypothetical protein
VDAAIPVDAKNAPTGIWKTAQNAVSHERPHPSSYLYEEDRRPKRTTLINLSTDSDQVQPAAVLGEERARVVDAEDRVHISGTERLLKPALPDCPADCRNGVTFNAHDLSAS